MDLKTLQRTDWLSRYAPLAAAIFAAASAGADWLHSGLAASFAFLAAAAVWIGALAANRMAGWQSDLTMAAFQTASDAASKGAPLW